MSTSLKSPLTDEQCRAPKYWCSVCECWKSGTPNKVSYNEIGFLSGSAGERGTCQDCGSIVSQKVMVMS